MEKQKAIQIPVRLFADMYQLIIAITAYGEVDMDLVKRIDRQIQEKFDAIRKRQLYTESKMASTEEEREQARKKYLEEIGMHPDWIWPAGYNHEEKRTEIGIER